MSSVDGSGEDIQKPIVKKKSSWLRTVLAIIGLFVLFYLFRKPTTKINNNLNQAEEDQTLKTPEEQIKNLVQKKLDGNNDMGWPYVEKIEITENSDGTYNADVRFNSDDNLSKGLIKTGVQIKTAEIMTALFTERKDIRKVIVYALFPLQDKYGNTTRGDIYVAELNVSEAKKVNWSIDPSTLALTILPKIYKVSYPNKIF